MMYTGYVFIVKRKLEQRLVGHFVQRPIASIAAKINKSVKCGCQQVMGSANRQKLLHAGLLRSTRPQVVGDGWSALRRRRLPRRPCSSSVCRSDGKVVRTCSTWLPSLTRSRAPHTVTVTAMLTAGSCAVGPRLQGEVSRVQKLRGQLVALAGRTRGGDGGRFRRLSCQSVWDCCCCSS